ncbi:hypothetical protein BIV57_01275 [Mangrovactinospora gilvigrisea]|uniref:ABC transporter substrate-binding protein n=1 Tax=Mangrovactinospora gilvigrisea TaxID=1428644 RepID=A0A1J7BLA9_9ACTN|nr:extracellular solute-binding protein [Mangrovactinospora gilvigrisea]OIV39491.1 hypothetical protein BIV57_01275 [Mangrovactinospora gilvigrisea]
MSAASGTTSRRTLIHTAAAAAAWPLASGCTSPDPPSRSKLRLMILGATPQLMTHLNAAVLPAFHAATGLRVELQNSDWGSAFQKVTTGAASNSLADVFMVGGIWTAALAAKHVMLDLTERLRRWPDTSRFHPAGLSDGAYRGRNYALPVTMDVRTGVYRQDLLRAAGITALPTTWAQFRAAAQRLKARRGMTTPIFWNVDKSIGLQQTFAQLFLQAGGRYWDSGGKAAFDSEAGHQALGFLVATFHDGLADVNQVYTGNGPAPLTSGASAMTLNGWAAQQNAQSNAPHVAAHIVAGPALAPHPGARPTPIAWIDKLAIAHNTKNPDGAWQLLTHLAGARQLDALARLSGSLPARSDLEAAPWLTPMARQVLANADHAVSQPVNPVMMQLGPVVQALLEPAVRGSVSVADTLKAIDTKVDALYA